MMDCSHKNYKVQHTALIIDATPIFQEGDLFDSGLRWGQPNFSSLNICLDCGHMWVTTKPAYLTDEEMAKLMPKSIFDLSEDELEDGVA